MDSVFVGLQGAVPEGYYPIYLLDDPDQAGDLGYHTEDPGGRPYGRVFARPVLTAVGGSVLSGGLSVASVLSHEVVEFFIDIGCNLWADRGDGTYVAYEACDPVEEDSYPVQVADSTGAEVTVSVSNFALAAWFDPMATVPGTQYDWLKKLVAPLQVAPGGYVVVLDSKTGKIAQFFASEEGRALHAVTRPPHPAARSARRAA